MSTVPPEEPDKGYTSSEFWVTVGGQLLAVLALIGIVPTGDMDKLTAILVKGVTSAFGLAAAAFMAWKYIQERSALKKAALEKSADLKIARMRVDAEAAAAYKDRTSRSLMPALLAFLFLAGSAHAQPQYAVVKIPSHGVSATVIWTQPGATYLLGCGHGYESHHGKDFLHKPMTIETPWRRQPTNPRITLIAVDFREDLSLVRVDEGPWPYSVAVTPEPFIPKELVSAGYDHMRGLVAAPTQLCTAYTRQRPVEGRSGGGLIDSEGRLAGVCQGYEVRPGGRGMYVDARTVRSFLARQGWRPTGGSPGVPQAGLPSPAVPAIPLPSPGGC